MCASQDQVQLKRALPKKENEEVDVPMSSKVTLGLASKISFIIISCILGSIFFRGPPFCAEFDGTLGTLDDLAILAGALKYNQNQARE